MMFLSGVSGLFFSNDIPELMNELNDINIFVSLFVLAVIPGVVEELVMRGVIFSGYKNVRLVPAILINGLFFAIFHLNPQQFLYAFVLGVIFAYMVRATRSIFVPIITHFIINASQVLIMYVLSPLADNQHTVGGLPEQILGIIIIFIIFILSAPFLAGVGWLFINHNKKAGTFIQNAPVKSESYLNWAFFGVIAFYALFFILYALTFFILFI